MGTFNTGREGEAGEVPQGRDEGIESWRQSRTQPWPPITIHCLLSFPTLPQSPLSSDLAPYVRCAVVDLCFTSLSPSTLLVHVQSNRYVRIFVVLVPPTYGTTTNVTVPSLSLVTRGNCL